MEVPEVCLEQVPVPVVVHYLHQNTEGCFFWHFLIHDTQKTKQKAKVQYGISLSLDYLILPQNLTIIWSLIWILSCEPDLTILARANSTPPLLHTYDHRIVTYNIDTNILNTFKKYIFFNNVGHNFEENEISILHFHTLYSINTEHARRSRNKAYSDSLSTFGQWRHTHW